MSMLEIKKFPDKILRMKSEPVELITDAERKLIQDMFDTMYFLKGVGLAAVQVGVLKRIIVSNPTGEKSDELAIINPKIIYRKGKRIRDCEGCLSIPNLTEDIIRFPIIGIKGQDLYGREIRIEAKDLLARIIAHEIDHLDGILFIDRVGFLKKRRLINKYRKQIGISCVGRWY